MNLFFLNFNKISPIMKHELLSFEVKVNKFFNKKIHKVFQKGYTKRITISECTNKQELETTMNQVPGATLTLSNKMAEYQRWKVTKDQLQLCVNDLWTSFNAINRPVSVTG